MDKKIFIKRLVISLLIIALTYGLYRASEKAYRLYQKAMVTEEMVTQYQAFANLCLRNIDRTNHSLVLDMLRNCVHQNSEHNVDKEFFSIASNAESNIEANKNYAQEVIKYAKQERDTKPHLECSKRARTLVSLYRALGYDARHIRVTVYKENFPDHVMTEVYNTSTENWEVQDASFNVHIKSVKTDKRLNMAEIIKLDTQEIVPCPLKGQCGWNDFTHDGAFHTKNLPLYSGIAYLGSYNDFGRGPLLYNPNKSPINKPIIHNGLTHSFCEKHKRQCHKTINILEESYSYDDVKPILF